MAKKMVTLPSTSQIPVNGGMFGPIETAHAVEFEAIRLMLVYGTEMYEKLKDGTKIKLTLENYNKDNGGCIIDPDPELPPTEPTPDPQPPTEPPTEETEQVLVVKEEQPEVVKTVNVPKNTKRK